MIKSRPGSTIAAPGIPERVPVIKLIIGDRPPSRAVEIVILAASMIRGK